MFCVYNYNQSPGFRFIESSYFWVVYPHKLLGNVSPQTQMITLSIYIIQDYTGCSYCYSALCRLDQTACIIEHPFSIFPPAQISQASSEMFYELLADSLSEPGLCFLHRDRHRFSRTAGYHWQVSIPSGPSCSLSDPQDTSIILKYSSKILEPSRPNVQLIQCIQTTFRSFPVNLLIVWVTSMQHSNL